MRRKVKARFTCHRCNHVFTSILGTFEIAFKIDGPTHYKTLNYPVKKTKVTDEISIGLTLYKMKCERCNKFCEGAIYESQLKAVAKSFCVVLA